MKIVQITDLHLDDNDRTPYGVDVWARAEWAIERARQAQPDIAVITGDIALSMGNRATYAEALNLLDRLACERYLIPGNHDARGLFAEVFGERYVRPDEAPWLDDLVTTGEVPMIFLDSADAVITDVQLQWLEDILKRVGSVRRIVWIHHPILTGFHRYMDAEYRLQNAERIRDLIARDGAETFVFCGHYHWEQISRYQNIVQYTTPSTYVQLDPDSAGFQKVPRGPAIRLIEISGRGAVETTVVYE